MKKTWFVLTACILNFYFVTIDCTNAEDWPMFHHDLALSGFTTSFAPNTNNILWTYQTGAGVYSSPAIVGNKIYVGSTNGNLYCLDKYEGTLIWSYSAGQAIYSSPAVDSGKVYFLSDNGIFYALNAENGSLVWSKSIGDGAWDWSSPAIHNGYVFVSSSTGSLYSLNANTGDVNWVKTFDNAGFFRVSPNSPISIVNGKVYTGTHSFAGDPTLFAVDEATGNIIWSYTTTGFINDNGATILDGDGDGNLEVYFGVAITSGNAVVCLNESNGNEIWTQNINGWTTSTPAIHNGKLFIGSNDGKLYALNASNGAYIWSYQTGDEVWSAPAVSGDGKVCFGSLDHTYYCLDENTGNLIWSYFTGQSRAMSSPAISDGLLVAGNENGNVYAFGTPENLKLVSPLQTAPFATMGDTISATFTIKNFGTESVTLDVVTVGGRDPNGLVVDFDWERNVTIEPSKEHKYSGKLNVPYVSGTYHFFCAYRTQDQKWNTSIDLGSGLSDSDRTKDITVLPKTYLNTPPYKERGGIIIPKDIFPEGDNKVIPVYVPQENDNANTELEKDGWSNIKEISRNKADFEWEKFVSSFKTTRADTAQEAGLSLAAGFLQALAKAITIAEVKIVVQTNSEGNFRAIILLGDPDMNTYLRKDAGLSDCLYIEPTWVMSKAIEDAFHLDKCLGLCWYYTMCWRVDSSHKQDNYIGYLSYRDNQIVYTPRIYSNDKISVNRVDFPIGGEEVLSFKGEGYISITESFIAKEEGKTISQMVSPIIFTPKSAIIAQAHSPIELQVFDSEGRATGLINGEIAEQIPDSMYIPENETVMIAFPTDTYRFEVIGTSIGHYGLSITKLIELESILFNAIDIPIMPNAVHQYIIDWNALEQGQKGTTIRIDSNGDGVVEQIITTGKEFTDAPPEVTIITPQANVALQDGTTFQAKATDISGVEKLSFSLREPDGGEGIPIGYEDLEATYNSTSGYWEYWFDTTKLQDGYYAIFAKATDIVGNEGISSLVPFSIRNWAVITKLPSTPSSKAGRTMPVKFSLRIASSVDPAMPFVYNEDLEIRIYDAKAPGTILQRSVFGTGSKDYRIDTTLQLYQTNFQTGKTLSTYVVEIWRSSKNFMVGSFTFKTVK